MSNTVLIEANMDRVDAIAGRIQEDGLVVIPGYLDHALVRQAANECFTLFDNTPTWAHREEYSLGKSVRMERSAMEPRRFTAILAAMEDRRLEAVVDSVFGADNIFSRTIYAIYDVVGSRTRVQQLHYDKMRHLKSFVYLSDVGPDNGPFHCVPGSHHLTRETEGANRRRRIVPTDDDVRQLPTHLDRDKVAVLGEAGTLILFDSDIAHHAGIVERGSRLAIRSLSFGAYRCEQWYRRNGEPEVAP